MTKKIDKTVNRARDRFREYLRKIWNILLKPELGILPGQLAFFMLLSLVPIITLIGFGAGMFNVDINTISNTLNEIFPGGSDLIMPYIQGNSIDLKLTIIFIAMFYIASNGFDKVILVSNQIYGINQSNWFKRRIKAIFMTLATVIILIFLLVVPVFGSHLLSFISNYINIPSNIYNIFDILRGPVLWLIMFVFIRTIYEISPDRVRNNSHISIGAIFTTLGWILCTTLYGYFAGNMTTYNIFYGALSNIAIVMLWLYFMSLIFCIGMSLNYGEELDQEVMNKTGAIKIVKGD